MQEVNDLYNRRQSTPLETMKMEEEDVEHLEIQQPIPVKIEDTSEERHFIQRSDFVKFPSIQSQSQNAFEHIKTPEWEEKKETNTINVEHQSVIDVDEEDNQRNEQKEERSKKSDLIDEHDSEDLEEHYVDSPEERRRNRQNNNEVDLKDLHISNFIHQDDIFKALHHFDIQVQRHITMEVFKESHHDTNMTSLIVVIVCKGWHDNAEQYDNLLTWTTDFNIPDLKQVNLKPSFQISFPTYGTERQLWSRVEQCITPYISEIYRTRTNLFFQLFDSFYEGSFGFLTHEYDDSPAFRVIRQFGNSCIEREKLFMAKHYYNYFLRQNKFNFSVTILHKVDERYVPFRRRDYSEFLNVVKWDTCADYQSIRNIYLPTRCYRILKPGEEF